MARTVAALPILFVILVLATANAQKIALSPSPASFALVSGTPRQVQFRLNAPIICTDLTTECSVVVRITNGDATAVSIDTCMVKWKSNEWSEVRTITITPRPSFVDDAQRTIVLTTSAANSSSPYYSGFNPIDITLETSRRRSSQCVATGDPHYTTFDGYYWHFYEVAQNVVYRSVALDRQFEIQSRLWIPPYSRHCALAGREDNDLVIIDFCTGSASITTRFSSPSGLTPRIVVSGSLYSVYFRSGAFMSLNWHGWGANVQFTAPGQDFNKTVGMCGNNNGNPNDDAAAYVVWLARDLLPTQRMNGRQDLWTWYPPASTPTNVLPPYAQECRVLDTPIVPILNNPGGIDITNSLTNNNNNNGAQTTLPPFVVNTPAPTNPPTTVDRNQAVSVCTSTILNSTLARNCGPLFIQNNDPTWSDRFVAGCVEDVMLMGYDPAWVAAAMQGVQNECAVLATQLNTSITNVFCPTRTTQPCSGHGACTNNVCVCAGSFSGVDCSIDSSLPPTITSLARSTCDVLGRQGCPDETISVDGANFLRSGNLSCRFNNTIVAALYMGSNQVLCAFPRFTLTGQRANLYIQVSNDLRTWSNRAPVTYYNSNCLICTSADACTPNPTSCTINGECIANGEINFGNPCQVCNSAANSSTWTYSVENAACWPEFDFPVYSFRVVGQVPANTPLGSVRAVNSFLNGDRTYSLNYYINSSLGNVPFKITVDPNHPTVAIVSTSQAIDVAALDQARLPSHFTIYAEDYQRHFASANGLVTFITRDTVPVFNSSSYTGSFPENTTVGTPILVVAAQPGSVPGPLTYDWVVADSHFALNTTTGVITLVQPLDWSESPTYFLQVSARDSTGQYQVVDIRFNVTYVPKPPTNIILSIGNFDEKQPTGSVVAVLSAVDPGSSSFTYTISPASVPFRINGNLLLSTATLDYETGPRTYTFTITVRDETGLTFTKTVTITVNNVIEPPQNVVVCPLSGCGSPFQIPDDTRVGNSIAVLNYSNPDNAPVTCSVYPNNTFGLVYANGVYSVTLLQPLDYVVATQAFIFPVCTVVNSRGAVVGSDPAQSVIDVINRPNAPKPPVLTMDPSLSSGIPENSGSIQVGTVTSVNPDPLATNIAFSIPTSDPSSSSFTLGTPVCTSTGIMSCTVSVILTGNLSNVIYNATGFGYVTVTVRTTDIGSQKFIHTVVIVPVQFVNSAPRPPTWVGNNNIVEESSPAGTEVGVIELSNEHTFVTQTATLLDVTNVYLETLTEVRRSEPGVTRLSVRLNNAGISYMSTPSFSFAVNVTNIAPNAPAMWAVHHMTVNVAHRPMIVALRVGSTLVKSNQTLDVAEGTPNQTVIGTLEVENFDRDADLERSFALIQNGEGYFTLNAQNSLVRTSKFLEYSTVQYLTVAIETTFTAKAANILPFTPSTISYFRLAVQPVNPAIMFTDNNQSGSSATVSRDALAEVVKVAYFQVSSRRNSLLRPSISNDPNRLFEARYENATDSFAITVIVTPASVNVAPGFYSQLIITVPDVSGTIEGHLNVTIQATLLFPGGGDRLGLFDQSTSNNGVASSTIAGIAVGVVVGLIVLVLLVAVILIRRRKQALDTKIANEPFYNQINGSGSLNNPTYLDQVAISSSLGFEPGLQNPMYAWYRPDMNRQESEEYLAEQVEGAFVIRDSAATPGWHMLAVKTHNAIVHEKIKMGDDGLYELLPSAIAGQPKFREMPLLVEHYAEQQQGVRYTLALDNPLYDNNHMAHKKHGHAVAGAWSYQADPNAPSVPLKERELAAVQQLAEDAAAGDEIYTNTEQAKTVISSA